MAPAAAPRPASESAPVAPPPPAEPVAATPPNAGLPRAAAPSAEANAAGGVVIPLFREGSDSRKTTLTFIIFAAVVVFGGGISVIWLLTRPSPEEVTANASSAASPVSPKVDAPVATPAVDNAPAASSSAAAPAPSPTGSGPVHDLLALGPPPSAHEAEGDLASPRTFRVIPEGSAHPDMIRFVEEAKVSGVSAGNPPRALINGRLVRGGALVEPKLGIVFLGLDTGRRTLIFRSATGDVVRLEY